MMFLFVRVELNFSNSQITSSVTVLCAFLFLQLDIFRLSHNRESIVFTEERRKLSNQSEGFIDTAAQKSPPSVILLFNPTVPISMNNDIYIMFLDIHRPVFIENTVPFLFKNNVSETGVC
jgi:hypothetical protein